MNQAPLISVVVICYNQEETIGRALDSILGQQTDYSFEIIIGEDASPTGNTRLICEQYALKFPNVIRVLPQAPNKGLMKNYSDCLKACRGKYIATCTGDDWWHNPSKLQLQVEFLENNPDFGVVHTEADTYDPITNQTFRPSRARDCPEGDVLANMFKVNFIYAISVLFRADLLCFTDFEEWIKMKFVAEDHAMWLAFAPHTLFHYIPLSTITYCSSLESASRSASLDKRLRFIEGICRIQLYFHALQNPIEPSYESLILFQKKWLIHEILVKKDYSKLKEYKATTLVRLAPFSHYMLSRVNLKMKTLLTIIRKGKTSAEFM
ncbi:glycosyltransferase family 2 protein [Flavobacterium frigoris]|uniref:Glycosyltransferase n=1 Tax=Flavobacterium frigoris (strain PS1) TaxID=1086011 RepID=H7FMK5_FLAFP|nr:glycosyltransferase family 2 protein [Flavobacterium frigoris]EIA10217.1 glycosyltransferase [Flavobacterium frigoris PS1]